jgi:glycosyltransferase involved in cell wall biosynthesis
MPKAVALIDYGCHSFTYRLCTYLAENGYPVRYIANGSLESPNLGSLSKWAARSPEWVRIVSCRKRYGKMSLRERLAGEIEWAGQCMQALDRESPSAVVLSCVPLFALSRLQSWATRRAVPMIYWLQDLQGRAIHDLLGRKLGFPGRVVGGLADIWEQQALNRSRLVITIASGHEQFLPFEVRRDGRHVLLENWANLEEIPLLPIGNEWSVRHGLHRTLNIVYSGTLGFKHDLRAFTALGAASKRRPDVRIVVVSSGHAADRVREQAAAEGLDNLLVLPFQPYEDVPKVLASAAVLIAPLDPSAGSFCVPSKILSHLCAGRPTVISIDQANPAAEIIWRAEAGTVVRPGDTPAFVSAVMNLLNDTDRRRDQGRNARAYAERTFNLEEIALRFLNILARAGIGLETERVRPPVVVEPRRSAAAAG